MKRDKIDISRESLYSTVGQFSVAIVAFVTLVVVSRELGPEAFGVYAALLAVGELIQSSIDGVSEGVKKRVSEKNADVVQLFSFSAVSYVVFMILVSALIVVVTVATDVLVMMNAVGLIAYLMGSSFFTLITSFNSGLGYPTQTYGYRILRDGLILGTQIPLVYLGVGENLLVVAAGVAWLLAGLALAWRRWNHIEIPTRETYESVVRFARWSVPNKLLASGNQRVPYFVIGLLATSTIVGYYEVAWKILTPSLLIPFALSNTLTVHISQQSSSGNSVRRELQTGLALATSLGFPILVGAVLLSDRIINLVYSPSYLPASEILPVLSLVVIFHSLIIIYQAALRGQDKPRAVSLVSAGRITLKTLFVVAGLVYGGLFGVVVGVAIADGLALLAYIVIEKTFADLRIFGLQIGASVVMGLVVAMLQGLLPLGSVYTAVMIGAGGVVYIGFLLWTLQTYVPDQYEKLRESLV